MKAVKEELLKWICKIRATNSYLDKRLLREKALELSRIRGLNDFKCSERWLNCFLREHGFSIDLTDHAGPTFANYRDWIDLMRCTIIKYKHNDLFHVDELTMYTDVLPSRIASEEMESELPINRVTILMGCNSSGTTKLPLLICGTYPSKITAKEHVYCNSEDCYIEDELYKNWLSNVNEQMFKSNRKILMFLRRSRAHTLKDFAPSNLKLVYLPENFPPLLRPLRKDVFHYVKMIFRRRYAEQLMRRNEEWKLRDTLRSLIEAWEIIPREIIVFSFQRTHFRTDDCLLQIDCDSWDSLKAGISFKRFVTFDDNLSDDQPFYEKNGKYHGYNLRPNIKNVIKIDENSFDPITESAKNVRPELSSPRFGRDYQIPSEVRSRIDQKLNEAWKERHRNARRSFLKNTAVENRGQKRTRSETRFSAMVHRESKNKNIRNPFVSRDSTVTSSRSIYGKTFKREEKAGKEQTETDTTGESLQTVINKALALTSLVNAEYTKKLIDSIHASIREISLQASNTKDLKSFRINKKMNCTSEEEATKTNHMKMTENRDDILTNLQPSKEEDQPSTSSNHPNSLSESAQSTIEDTECVSGETSFQTQDTPDTPDLHTRNCEESQENAKVNSNDEESFDRQEDSNLKKKRKKPSEDDSSADEPSEKKSKMDPNWTKQFETNFVFGSQNTNCFMGIRHDDKTVESCVFNRTPSVSPRD